MSLRIAQQGLTFDDVLLIPSYSQIHPNDVNLKTNITNKISLAIPLLSAAMDTVTEARMAIAMAQAGGLGIIHKNMTIERQVLEVRKVKKHESGVVNDPVCVAPDLSIAKLIELITKNQFSGVPVVEDKKLVGIVTSRDIRFETNLELPVSAVMTPKHKLITVRENASREHIKKLLHKHRIEKLLVVNDNFDLKGLITVKDIQKAFLFPFASKDSEEQLLVGAAVGVGHSMHLRIESLIDAGVDVLVLDTAHAHSKKVLDQVLWIKKKYPNISVIAGNIATGDAAKSLLDVGADSVKVGIGPGSICTTRIIAGVGIPQITAIANVADSLSGAIPIIADGGIRFSGDIGKAIAAGASSVMIGGLFAGAEESPGEIELYQGATYKNYRGMGSMGAMSQNLGSSDRYYQDHITEPGKLVPEGIEGRVPYKGPVQSIIHQLTGGLRACMGYTGSETMQDLMHTAKFVQITSASQKESHVHDVSITKQAPNYQVHK